MREKDVTILMADDDMEDMELLEEAILGLQPSANLLKFTNGAAAVQYLTRCPGNELPGIIVLDYNMPEMTGAEVLVKLRQHAALHHVPKVMVSTSNAPLHIHECLTQGAAEYLVKPNSMRGYDTLASKILGYISPEN